MCLKETHFQDCLQKSLLVLSHVYVKIGTLHAREIMSSKIARNGTHGMLMIF